MWAISSSTKTKTKPTLTEEWQHRQTCLLLKQSQSSCGYNSIALTTSMATLAVFLSGSVPLLSSMPSPASTFSRCVVVSFQQVSRDTKIKVFKTVYCVMVTGFMYHRPLVRALVCRAWCQSLRNAKRERKEAEASDSRRAEGKRTAQTWRKMRFATRFSSTRR